MKNQNNNQGSNKDQQFDKNARPGGNEQPQGSQEQLRHQQQGTQNQPQGSRNIGGQQPGSSQGQNTTKSGNEQRKGESKSADLNQPDTNEANRMGAINTGMDGTKATASQQQGQGLKSAKNPASRSGSDSGQNTNKKGS
jgi:hypothetical protein